MPSPSPLTIRVGTKGIQTSSDSHYLQFYEYNTIDEQGNVVSPESNILEFTASDKASYETILKQSETDRFQLRNVYPDWQPDEDCRQVTVSSCQLDGTTLSWTTSQTPKAILIERNGELVAIVDGTTSSYALSGASDGITVRAANSMGGFGEPAAIGTSTAISEVNGSAVDASPSSLTRKYIANGRIIIEKDGLRYTPLGQQTH